MWTGLLQLKYLKYRSSNVSPLLFQIDLGRQSSTSSITLPDSIVDVPDKTKMAIVKIISEQIKNDFSKLNDSTIKIDGNEYIIKITKNPNDERYIIKINGNGGLILSHTFNYDEKNVLLSAENFEFKILENLSSCIVFNVSEIEPALEQKSSEDRQDVIYSGELNDLVDSFITKRKHIFYKEINKLIIPIDNLEEHQKNLIRKWFDDKRDDKKIYTISIPVNSLVKANTSDFYKLELVEQVYEHKKKFSK